ncbi:MAG: hypothetical protein WCI67_20140 [Chloroflexales bacterium]
MARRIIVGVCCLLMIAATFAVPGLRAQTTNGLSLVTELTLPGSNDTKFPHSAAANGRVYISGNVDRSSAVYWTKAASAVSFPDYTVLGDASGKSDYSNTSVKVAPNGTIYYAWDDNPSRTIYMRTVDTAGNLGPIRVVDKGSAFPVAVEVAISTSNEIFVTWRNPDATALLRRSSDNGVSWTDQAQVSSDVVAGQLDMATGPSGKVAISYTAGAGGRLQIFVGLWDSASSSFVVQRVTSADADYADSSVSLTPDGNVFAAWRGVADSGGASGVFYAQRQSDGSWPRSRLVGGKVTGTVNLDSDEQGNLHLAWIGQPSGGNQLYYAFKPAIDAFRGPIASGNVGDIFNPQGSASATPTATYEHVVSELFSGSKLYTRYSLFQAQGSAYGATPQIEGDAATVGGKTTAQVTFTNPSGVTAATTQVRWRWNAAPTDAVNDSGGWVPYATTITVPIPESIRNSTSCAQSTLYTQLRDPSQNLLEDPAKSDTILVDGAIQASVDVHNPFINVADTLSGTASTAALPPELALSKGAASGGDPLYTRVPLIYLSVHDAGDCTGITSVAVGKSADAIETTYKSDASGFSGMIPLPDLANLESGLRPVVVQLRDGAGNVGNYTFNITYDDTKPTFLSADLPTTTPNTYGDIIQDLHFTNVKVDDAYTQGSRHFWGVWLANSTSKVSDPLNAPLKWKAMPASGTDTSFTIKDWSLATGLASVPAPSKDGSDYFIYVRFLDGAGNPTSEAPLEITVHSTSTRLKTNMPLIIR